MNLMNEDSTLKTEVYLKEVVFVLHHEGILTQLYMGVTEKLQAPSTLTPKESPIYPLNVRLDGAQS